jgi:8-oxo-dGTP pyrophosphatase MutT (NUDIX family)
MRTFRRLFESSEEDLVFSHPKDRKTGRPMGEPSPAPDHVNGVPLRSWRPPDDWSSVEGQNHQIQEPALPEGRRMASGLLIREHDGRTWLTRPTGGFGGYKHTFPKGKVDPGLHPQANAIKEAWEETGIKARVTGFAGDHEGDTSTTRFYHAVRETGHPHDHGWESEAVVLAHPRRLPELLNRERDQEIVKRHLS